MVGGFSAEIRRNPLKSGKTVLPDQAMSGLRIIGNRIGLDGTGQRAHAGRGASVGVVATPVAAVGGVVIEGNSIAGGSPESWLAGGGVSGAAVTNNQIGLAFDGSGNLPAFVSAENKGLGVRLDNSSNTTISGNTVVNHQFNVIVSGENQYRIVGEEFETRVPGSELDPAPAGGPSVNVTIEGNTIGLFGEQKPTGVAQEYGVTVFGNARTVTVRNNTIAGHSDMEVRLKNGEGHLVMGNRIGTANGTNYGSAYGIVVNDANGVTIGSAAGADQNVVGQNAVMGIRIQGAAEIRRMFEKGTPEQIRAFAEAVWKMKRIDLKTLNEAFAEHAE